MCTSPSRRSRRVRWSTCWPWCPRRCAQVGWFEAWLPCRYQYSRLRSPKEGGGYCASIQCTSVVPNFAKPRILIGLSRMIWQRCPDHQRSWRLELKWQWKLLIWVWKWKYVIYVWIDGNLPITERWRKWLNFGNVLIWHSYLPASSGWTLLQ